MKKNITSRGRRKKALYKLIVARADINAALKSTQLFIKKVKSLNDPIYYLMLCSIIICYARPFTNNEGLGCLPKKWGKFKRRKFQEGHDSMIQNRNKIIAHSDLDFRTVNIIPPDVEFEDLGHTSSGIMVAVSNKFYKLNAFPVIEKICSDLYDRLESEIEKELGQLYENRNLPKKYFPLTFDENL